MRFLFDLDGTICETKREGQRYSEVKPYPEAIDTLNWLRDNGHTIIIHTARHMKTCNGDQGKVIGRQGKVLFDWLDKWEIPYDELYFGKPYADLTIDDATHQHTDWTSTKMAIITRINNGPRA